MMQTLVGRDGFARGMKLYFERHDGHAVTCDDFAQAQADANPGSPLAQMLPQFKRWYSQAGTPHVRASAHYDAPARRYTLTLSQSCAPTPEQEVKEPFVIPVNLGLVGADGQDLPLRLEGEAPAGAQDGRFVLSETSQTLVFLDVDAEPVPSILRGFSAPVVLEFEYSDAQLLHLLAHDSDPFNRWEAGQRLAMRCALQALQGGAAAPAGGALSPAYVDAMRALLRDARLDTAFKELVLTLPSEGYIAEQLDVVDPQQVHAVRDGMRLQLARALASDWEWAWETHQDTGVYQPDPASAGRRALSGMALAMLCLASVQGGGAAGASFAPANSDAASDSAGTASFGATASPSSKSVAPGAADGSGASGRSAGNDTSRSAQVWPGKAYQRFKSAGNMTDRFNALAALVGCGHELATQALARFHAMFKNDALVLDKWFALQAGAPDRGGNVLPQVKQLMKHSDFSMRNPNRARSLLFSYCSANPGAFHRHDAAGYVFWSERVLELDPINPQVAARLARALDRWSRLAEPYRGAAREALARVAARPSLSKDVREVVTRALSD